MITLIVVAFIALVFAVGFVGGLLWWMTWEDARAHAAYVREHNPPW